MPTICLCMMVKNESHIIRRALLSAMPFIDTWMICDTGSTDGTQAIIRETLKDIPGELYEVNWVNFGVNRTQAVRMARSKADYILILDADLVLSVSTPYANSNANHDLLVAEQGQWLRNQLTADAYELRYQGSLDYTNTRLVSSKHDWYYVGVTHEYIASNTATNYQMLPSVSLLDFGDGGNRADKFERDIRLLLEGLEKDPNNSRYVFYLAQSYKDLNRYGEALHWYERRITMGGFEEERWYAMFMKARMMQAIGIKWSQVREAYLDAYECRPSRLEPLYEIVKHYREAGQYAVGFTFASVWFLRFPYPSDRLFIDRPVYTYLFAYEFWELARMTGHGAEAAQSANQYLREQRGLPSWLHNQVTQPLKALA